jgi:hypothetical protein
MVARYRIGFPDTEFESLIGAKSDVPELAQSAGSLDPLRHNSVCKNIHCFDGKKSRFKMRGL